MGWQLLTAEQVRAEMAPQEIASHQNWTGGVDPLPVITGNVVLAVRAACQRCGFQIGDEGTIPDSLRMQAIALARWKYLLALQAPMAEARKTDGEAAEQLFREGDVYADQIAASVNPRTGTWNSEAKILSRTHPVPAPPIQDNSGTSRPYANPNGPSDE